MTTRITVDAHAGWPVEVVTIVGEPNSEHKARVTVVPVNTKQDFYIHSGMRIVSICELAVASGKTGPS